MSSGTVDAGRSDEVLVSDRLLAHALRSRNGAKRQVQKALQDAGRCLASLDFGRAWVGDEVIRTQHEFREALERLNKFGHEMNAYSNTYNTLLETKG